MILLRFAAIIPKLTSFIPLKKISSYNLFSSITEVCLTAANAEARKLTHPISLCVRFTFQKGDPLVPIVH